MTGATLKAWIQASRPQFFVATLVPLFIGLMLGGQGWQRGLFLVVLLGSLAVHLATNIANDYFDYVEGTDSGEAIGGSRVIQQGKIAPQSLLKALVILYGLAFVTAFYIMITRDLFVIFPLIIFSFLSSVFYVAPPIRYGYHGLGELFVGANMGPIMVVGTYWVLSGSPDWRSFWISIPVGLMVASILYYQSLPDMKTDFQAGKYTLAVRLGRKRAYLGLIAFFVVIYASIVMLALTGSLSFLSLLCLLTIPIFLKLLGIVRTTGDWVLLDQHGKYVRMLYFLNGIAIILGLL
jgi:1,4-dihydroxy-2-naphthoate octaprenyltransferase